MIAVDLTDMAISCKPRGRGAQRDRGPDDIAAVSDGVVRPVRVESCQAFVVGYAVPTRRRSTRERQANEQAAIYEQHLDREHRLQRSRVLKAVLGCKGGRIQMKTLSFVGCSLPAVLGGCSYRYTILTAPAVSMTHPSFPPGAQASAGQHALRRSIAPGTIRACGTTAMSA
jgi:hypothetical protein